MNTFKIGDTVERVESGPYTKVGAHYKITRAYNHTKLLKLEGHGESTFQFSRFKLVPERDVKRKALSDAIDLITKHDIGRVRGSNNEFYYGSMDNVCYLTKESMLDAVYPDNKEAEDKIQAIIESLQDNLVTAQQQLTDLKGE